MLRTIRTKSHDYIDKEIDELKDYCEQYPNIAEMVRYIVAYSDEMAYCDDGSDDAKIGREIIHYIWQISKYDLSNIANSYHFSSAWAYDLNHFIGNWILDDFAFDFKQGFQGQYEFFTATDDSRWFQDPRFLIEAAKATIDWQNKDPFNRSTSLLFHKVDGTKVDELLKERV